MLRFPLQVIILLVAVSATAFGLDEMPPASSTPEESPPASSQWDNVNVFKLNSNSGAKFTIYLDFTGHTTTHIDWTQHNKNGRYGDIVTPTFDLGKDNAPNDFGQEELRVIGEIWARVAEDYAPFDVNVTTIMPENDTIVNGIRVCIGGNSQSWYDNGSADGVGGLALRDTFKSEDKPAFVFPGNLANNAKYIGECVSHEVGHTFGLRHDGIGSSEYHPGNGDWAPIMGTGYYSSVTQWSKGDYDRATNTDGTDYYDEEGNFLYTGDDDLGKISYELKDVTNNDTGYRIDQVGNCMSEAAELFEKKIGDSPLKFFQTGIIETSEDVDVFSFTLGKDENLSLKIFSGIWDVQGEQILTGANLDILAKLFFGDSPVNLLGAWGDPQDNMDISEFLLSSITDLVEGTYYLWIEGTGTDLYPDYGSIGTYAIEATIFPASNNNPDTAPAPEPKTQVMFWLGVAGLALLRRKKNR